MSLSPSQLASAVSTRSQPRGIPFTQLYNAHIRDLRQLLSCSPAAFDLLLAMVEIMGRRNSLVASVAALMRITNKSKSTILRAVGLLERSNFVQRINVDGATVYTVNQAIVWKDKPEYRGKMALMDAKIISFDFEQPADAMDHKVLKKLTKPKQTM